MAALIRINVNRKDMREVYALINRASIVFERPFAGERGVKARSILKKGIDKQFQQGGDPPWPKSKPFGNRQPRRPTLGGTGGRVAMAWQRAKVEMGPREVRIRQTEVIALAHHRGAIIRPVQPAVKMRYALGLAYGVWLSEERLVQGLRLPQRPVRMTKEMVFGIQLGIFAGFQSA